MNNLGELLKKSAHKNRDKVAYEIRRGFRTERFTFDGVENLSRKTASFLSQNGVGKGDGVAVWATNMPEYPILYFGIWLLGAVAVPIDVRTKSETLKLFLKKAPCKIGFKGQYVPGSLGGLVKKNFILEDLVELVQGQKELKFSPKVSRSDLAEIAFTSGTTGTPKGVVLTHGNFLASVDGLLHTFPLKPEYRALSLLPLSHAFEQVVDFLGTFVAGVKITYVVRSNRLTVLKALQKGKITSVAVVPQGLRLLITGIEREVEKQGKTKIWNVLNKIAPALPFMLRRKLFKKVHEKLGGSLIFFGCGSAPLDLKLAQKWENIGIDVFEGYGATETTALVAINKPGAKRLGSVGQVLPGVEVKLDPETSEIMVRGDNVSSGYYKDREKTDAAFQNGWYRTGDIGKLDSDGFLYITGREAFRIVLPDGRKAYPEDIEKRLNTHPLVSEACVVGVAGTEGEVVHAVVLTKYKNRLDSIIRDVNKSLSSHEQILQWSAWPEEDFPRTPILKIDRKVVLAKLGGEAVKAEKTTVSSQDKQSLTLRDKLANLILQVAKGLPAPAGKKVTDKSTLATDLGIDSLSRVELLSLVEEEFAVAIPETKITPSTTVGELRKIIDGAPTAEEEISVNWFWYGLRMQSIRMFLQDFFAFPIHSLFALIKVSGQENLQDLHLPAIFYFNHIGIMDAACVLRVLPRKVRRNLVIAVNEDLGYDYRRRWVEIFGGGFPFDKDERVKASLELTADFLDRGQSVLMAPEGVFSKDGKLMEFKPGAGFMAVSMQVPVVPIKIAPAYLEIFPPQKGGFFENLPKKRKTVRVAIGKPLTFDKKTSYDEATEKMRKALEELL